MKTWFYSLSLCTLGAFAQSTQTEWGEISRQLPVAQFQLRAAEGGAGSTGGGDEKLLLQTLKDTGTPLPEILNDKDLLKEFVRLARNGIGELEKYSQIGWVFPGEVKLSASDIKAARKIIDDLEKGRNGKRFLTNDGLLNPATGEPRLAQNSQGGDFMLNPRAWALLAQKYVPTAVERIRTVMATHEVLQQEPLRKEGTGNFAASSQLLKIVPAGLRRMELGLHFSAQTTRLEIRRGLPGQASCRGRDLLGEIEIRELGKSSRKGRVLIFSNFQVRNPELCRQPNRVDPKTGGIQIFKMPRLMDLSTDALMGVPSITLFALACTGPDVRSCSVVDFQTLPGEPIMAFYEDISDIQHNDYRSEQIF
jgi:hypothetical protein